MNQCYENSFSEQDGLSSEESQLESGYFDFCNDSLKDFAPNSNFIWRSLCGSDILGKF